MALVRSILPSAETTHGSTCNEAAIGAANTRRPRYERRSDPLSPSTAAASAAPVSIAEARMWVFRGEDMGIRLYLKIELLTDNG